MCTMYVLKFTWTRQLWTIRLETKSCRILLLTYGKKYDLT